MSETKLGLRRGARRGCSSGGASTPRARRTVEEVLPPKQGPDGSWTDQHPQEREAGKVYTTKGRRTPPTPEAHPRREPGLPQPLWVADTMHGPSVVDAKRRKRKTYLLAVLDDASRTLMAVRFAVRDDISAFLPVLREAVLARGLPSRLLTDNGPNCWAKSTRSAAASTSGCSQGSEGVEGRGE